MVEHYFLALNEIKTAPPIYIIRWSGSRLHDLHDLHVLHVLHAARNAERGGNSRKNANVYCEMANAFCFSVFTRSRSFWSGFLPSCLAWLMRDFAWLISKRFAFTLRITML